MSTPKLRFLLFLLLSCINLYAQDTASIPLQQLPKKYLADIATKVDKYSNRLTSKTEKTLEKLSRWENKIKTVLEKTSPETAQKLFAPGQITFTTALQKYKEGKSISDGYTARYDQYRDQLTTQLKYLEEKKEALQTKYVKPLVESKRKIAGLEDNVENTEALQQFITERKKQLMQEALKHLGKSKYLQKINKEAFYYTETLRNYKEIFNEPGKAEETALNILNKVPFFKKFMQENSQLASLFGPPQGVSGSPPGAGGIAGLQTRASVNALIQDRIAGGGPNAMQAVQQNIQQAQAELSKLKDKLLKAAGAGGDADMPDFKPNMQKTKTLAQRMEYGLNFQSIKSSSLLPSGVDIGLSIGYKINDKSVAGIGVSYKFSMGTIDKLKFSHEGIGLRSFMDWKLKKQFFVSGGFEMNHHASFKNVSALQQMDAWQQSGLLGVSKKIAVKSKLMKAGKLQLLYDFLHRQHVPVSQPVVFRIGYEL